MSNTRKLSTSSKSPKFQPKRLNSSFFPNASLEKNFDYFFLQFLLYKKNLANKKLNSLPCLPSAGGALTFPPEKGAYASLKANFGKEKFSSTQQNSQASDFKFSDEKFSGHFLFLAPSNSLFTFTLKGQKFDKKESPVAFSNKAIKFSLAPGRSSSSFSLINNSSLATRETQLFQRKSADASLENFVNSTNNVAKRREPKSLVTQAAYNSSTVLLDSHTRKAFLKKKREPFFYYWLLPFFGFLTNINPKDALTEKQKRTNFSIYPATKNVNKQNSEASDLVEFDYKSPNFVNPNWELSSKKEKCRENKSLLQNLPTLGFFEKKNWQQNFLQFFVLPNLNYQPSSSVFVAYLSAFGRPVSLFQNLKNKTKHSLVTQAILPYKLSLFNTNQNIPKNLNDKIVLESLPQNKKRSVRVNKLPFSRYARGLRFAFSGVSNKKLNPQTNYLPAYGRQCLRFANSLAPREALTGISATGKLTPNNVFSFRLPLAGDFQKLDLFRINQNIADFSESNSLASRENFFSVGKAPLKVFWNSDFKLALKIRRFANNLTLRYSFLNRKTNLTKRGQNFSVKPNNYTQFVFNSLFSNFDNQKRAKRRENEELKNFNPVLKDRITAERLDPKLLKKSELNYLILNSLQNTLNTVKRSNSTQIKKELEAMRLEQNLQTINNLENLKVNLRCATNSYFAMQNKESYNCLPTADGAYASLNFFYFGYFNSTTKSSKRNKEKTFLGFNLLNSHILIKIKTPEKFVQPAENLKKQFIKPILVNKAVYPAFNSLALQELQKKVPTLRYKNSEASEKVEATEGFTFSVGKASLLNFQNTASRFALLNSTSFARSLAPYYQNKSYNNNITYIESLKNQLKLTLTKQNFIAKRGKLRNQELSPTLRYKNGYLLRFAKTEKLVRNFLVRNKAAYSIFSERKKIKNLSSLEFAEKKKAKEAIFAFLKNQLRYSLSNPLRFNKRSSASKFSQRFARPRKLAKRRSGIFSPNSLVRKSSALILKNRRFFGKKFSQRFAISSEALETKICEKRQKIAKKRKLKKQKKENRRRKKRKRFYPRPVWIRSRLYNFSFASRLRETVPSEKGAYASLKASANKNFFFNNMKFSNFDYSPNILPAEQRKAFSIFTMSNYSFSREARPVATREKDLYTISRPVLGELKRVLWKSYWLRKNLNTYTTKIKKELRVLQEEQRKESLFETISLIVKYLAGFDSGVFNCLPSVGGPFNSSVGFEQRLARANANQFYSVSSPAYGRQCLSLWQSAINLAEYNRLVYERMQKMIFSIRENLSSQEEMQRHIIKQLNFAHPSFKSSTKFARAKQNSSDPNSNTENKDFWLKLGKTLTFELPQSPQAFYGNTKKNRMHWALSKTYKNFREINNNKRSFSKRQNLWSTGILREQSKANKTKKLLYNLTKNIYSGIKFVKNPNFSVTKDLGLPRIDYIYLSKIRKTEQKLGYFGFSSLRFAKKNRNKLNNKENKKYRLLFENQSFQNIPKNYSLPIQTSNYFIFYKKANNLADLQNTKNINNNAPSLASERQGASRGNSLNNLQPKSSSLKVASHNLQKQYWWTFSDNNFFNFLRFEKWVSRLRGTSYSFNSVSSINKVESQSPAYRLSQARGLLVVYISSFLFHFCCLISLISISQIRGIIKFGLILFSKVTNVGNQIFNLLFSVCQFFDGKFAKTSTNQLTTKSTNCLPTAGSAFFCLWQARRLAPPKFSYEASDSSLLNKVGKRMTKTRETDYKQISEASESSFQNLTTSVETKKIKNSEASDFFGNLFSTKNSEASEFRRFAKKIYYTVYLEYLAQRRQKNVINPKNGNIFSKKKRAKGNNLTKQSINVSQKSELFNSFSSEKGLYASPYASPLLQLLKLISFNSQKGYNSARFIYKISNRVLEQILGTVTKTTAFFSRPGEFIGDWLAYLFLVEWSADLKTTIPDQIFQSYYLTINKLARLTYSASALNLVLRFALSSSNLAVGKGSASPYRSALIGSVEKESLIYNSNCLSTAGASLNFYNLNNFSSILFSFAFSKILQRRISVLFEDILEKFFQPDTDLLVRQRKSTIFWDIWGDYLVLVAEDSSINLSELTSLKEEQIKLLEILLSNSALYSAQKTNNMFITNLTQKLSNFRMSRLPSAGGAFHSTQDSSLRFALRSAISASPKIQRSVGLRYSQNLINDQKLSNIVLTKEEKFKDFWGANQFLSYQSVVFSDLFIDLHPPKSFSNFNSIKYSDSLQHPIGSMVCQIYSGIFTRQISKNLLIVGAQGMEKSLLIQALAGETEFPLITDNAYRYIMVQQGVAVGIKLLRDVFDALALHTPCLFLLEDIHAIGERRPFLISDDQIHGADLLKNEFAKTGLDERNQIIYQLSKHVVSHFKKPYKGDFSLTIPTNQFCFEYLGNNKKGSIYQKPASIHLNTKQNLLNSSFIKGVKNMKKQQSQNSNNFEKFITNNNDQKTKNSIFASYLQVPSNQLLAPPATSPFSVLVLKESRDTKNSAVVPVKEMPWSGLPGEQYSLMNKASYSVRVKVALLADMAISNLSVKLDMITDLLVIIDSVKGNRGFAVFATTHVPSILDPALRRPGRLDETILVPKSSVNMLCRWEVFKSQFSLYNVGTQNSGFSRSITIDFSRLVFNTNQNLVKQNFVQNKLNLFAQFNSTSFIQRFAKKIERKQKLHKSFPMETNFAYLPLALREPVSSKNISKRSLKPKISLLLTEKSNLSYASPFISLARKNQNSTVNNKSPAFDKQCLRFTKNLVSHSYFVVSEKLISSLFNKRANRRDNMHRLPKAGNNKNNNLHDSTALALGVLELNGPHSRVDSSLYLLNSLKNNNSIYPVLYAPPKLFKDYFVNFMAGKIGEMFLSTAYYNTNSFFNISPQKNLITQSSYGIEKTWRHISDFATQLIQKRYLYNQRLFSLSNIFFTNNSNFKEPPGPPNSNVLLPARRSLASQEAAFNYQRNFYSQISRSSNNLNIHEKIQLHQQQRLVKRLYGYSVQGPSAEGRQFFFLKKQENNNTGTSFANAPLVLGKHELIREKPSSSTWFYQKKILLRHKNYLTNQWWNAQLPEHNAETTFLSDIDWRYSFVDPEHSHKTAKRRSGVNKKQNVQKSKTQDLFIDFPDSVQYYNPRNRRWVLTKKEQRKRLPTADQNNNTQQITNFVNIFDFSEFSQEIYSHFLFDAYVKAYNILNQNREILDYFASKKLTSACVTSDLTDKLDISFE